MEPPDETLDAVFWRDEILQIMYWLRGEELGEAVSPENLVAFLGIDAEKAREHMERMVEDGYLSIVIGAPGFYELSEWGMTEGKRHFAEEFAGLTNQGHGECNNPDCACHTLGPAACEHRLEN